MHSGARLVRSIAAGLACTGTAGVGHLSAGGALSPQVAVLCLVAASAVAWLMSSRRITTGQMVGLLILCQVGVHLSGSMDSMTMSAAMLVNHAAATALSAFILARGEAFVWRVAERLGLRRRPLLVAFAPTPTRAAVVPVVSTRSLRDVRLAWSRALRGPPYVSQ